jgi:hypothetical protein
MSKDNSNDNNGNNNNSNSNNTQEGHFGGPVGKGNPPKSGQFKKGQSGNPKGQPKKKKNSFKEDVAEILNSKVELKNGKGKEVVRKIILQNLAAKATKGDATALKYIFPLIKMTDDSPEMEMLPEDEAIIKDVAESLGYKKENKNDS